MFFATTTVAARIERAEVGVVRDFAERAGAAGKDVLIEPVGGTHAVYGGPGEPFNKVVGLGLNGPVDESAIARLEAAYDARGAEIRVEQCTLADPAVAMLLTRRGYELIGYENVLGLALTSALAEELSHAVRRDAEAGIAIARPGTDQIRVWIETAIDGFLAPDQFDGPSPTETFDRETLRYVRRGLRRSLGDHRTGVEVAAERPARGVRVALLARHPPPRRERVIAVRHAARADGLASPKARSHKAHEAQGEFNRSTQQHRELEAVCVCVDRGCRGVSGPLCGSAGEPENRSPISARHCGGRRRGCIASSRRQAVSPRRPGDGRGWR